MAVIHTPRTMAPRAVKRNTQMVGFVNENVAPASANCS
jgi:hypothetical protein